MRATSNHVETALLRAIIAVAGLTAVDRQKPMIIIEDIRSADWASATFVGSTHDFELRLEGTASAVEAAMAALASGLAERNIALAGQIVAEIGILPGDTTIAADDIVAKQLTVNVLVIKD